MRHAASFTHQTLPFFPSPLKGKLPGGGDPSVSCTSASLAAATASGTQYTPSTRQLNKWGFLLFLGMSALSPRGYIMAVTFLTSCPHPSGGCKEWCQTLGSLFMGKENLSPALQADATLHLIGSGPVTWVCWE